MGGLVRPGGLLDLQSLLIREPAQVLELHAHARIFLQQCLVTPQEVPIQRGVGAGL